ncbi:type VI secretion system protein TssA [Phycisphaeraceae bacterium D3-23]
MTDSGQLDFDRLTAPIDGEAPAGPDLRKDYTPEAVYRHIKDARQRAGKAERNTWESEDETAPNAAVVAATEWAEVLKLSPDLLYTQSKDLEVAAWLTEALVRSHGFAGLADGFRACTLLVENFWDTLHPNPDPEDEDDEDEGLIRVAALAGLNGTESRGTLIAPIMSVALVDSDESGNWGLSAFEQAAALQAIDDHAEREKRMEHGVVTLEMFNNEARGTSPAFFEALSADLNAAQEWFGKLEAAIEARCAAELCPPTSYIRSALTDCQQRLQAFINEFAPSLGDSDEAGADASTGESAGATGGAQVGGPIQTREQAFSQIRLVADYFRKTEPHSVLSWQLEECVKWGHMSLPELLKELIDEQSSLENIYKRIGIPPPDNEESM